MATPRHILELRELVGQRLLLVPSVTAAIFDGDERMLLVRITGSSREFWTLPGGLLEPDEVPVDAVVREVREETGLDVTVGQVVGTFGGPEFRHTYANGDQASYVMTVWHCHVTGGVPRVDGDEIAELRWCTRDEASSLPGGAWLPDVVAASFDAAVSRARPRG